MIVSPHFPPSNLAGVHRSRLFAQHLPAFGWEPVILTVDEKYYEEKPDYNLVQLLPSALRIEKVKAYKVSKPRLIGDIGLRAFWQLYKRAKAIIRSENINFLYIPIPSFYVALLGRWLHESTGIRYGIDYIDPWVHTFPGSNKIFSRHWFSTKMASLLEPVAVKKASLITGVAAGYYKGVQERNPFLMQQAVFAAMPYGGEKTDHEKLKVLGLKPYLFEKKAGKVQLVYAGAMLPKAYKPLEAILSAIKEHEQVFKDLEIHFIGTGTYPDDKNGFNIKPLAEKFGLWEEMIFEYPARISYLDVLVHLEAADGVFILGSTEPHYTPSKVYQAILSKKPILAVLHTNSPAVQVTVNANAGIVLDFNGEMEIEKIRNLFVNFYNQYITFLKNFTPEMVNEKEFDLYSAYEVTRSLSQALTAAKTL